MGEQCWRSSKVDTSKRSKAFSLRLDWMRSLIIDVRLPPVSSLSLFLSLSLLSSRLMLYNRSVEGPE